MSTNAATSIPELLAQQAAELATELDGPYAASIWRRYRITTLQRMHHAEIISALATA